MKFLFGAQALRATAVCVNKYEAKCSVLVERHLLFLYTLH